VNERATRQCANVATRKGPCLFLLWARALARALAQSRVSGLLAAPASPRARGPGGGTGTAAAVPARAASYCLSRLLSRSRPSEDRPSTLRLATLGCPRRTYGPVRTPPSQLGIICLKIDLIMDLLCCVQWVGKVDTSSIHPDGKLNGHIHFSISAPARTPGTARPARVYCNCQASARAPSEDSSRTNDRNSRAEASW
jgi:hypothetical protein